MLEIFFDVLLSCRNNGVEIPSSSRMLWAERSSYSVTDSDISIFPNDESAFQFPSMSRELCQWKAREKVLVKTSESNGGARGEERMELLHQWWRMRFSFKSATIVVCFFNLVAVLLLLQGFLSAFSYHKLAANQTNSVQLRYIKESEEIRRAMEPLELIRRVREIEQESYKEPKQVQQKDTKQTAAVDLATRLNNLRSYSDSSSMKALEEWRKRKMERARQRGLGKNGTAASQA